MTCKSISEVVEKNLCCGCGGCVLAAPEKIVMLDVPSDGLRPKITNRLTKNEERVALALCPGVSVDYKHDFSNLPIDLEYLDEWGPILGVSEGHATNEEIRYKSSSGGVITALSVLGLEKNLVDNVLQVGANSDFPYVTESRLNATKDEVINSCGSRYAPASPCELLPKILKSNGKSIVVGKPCDITAIYKARKVVPELDEKISLMISIFCAATPSTDGTKSLIKKMGEPNVDDVISMRYRGHGWPGMASVVSRKGGIPGEGDIIAREMTYAEAWGGELSKRRQWRCNLCPDHVGEFADISVGDPWYREITDGELGSSLVLIRTRKGKEYYDLAIQEEYVSQEVRPIDCLPRSQPYLINVAGMIWGRVFALRLFSVFGVGVPKLSGKPFFKIWIKRLSFREKVVSILGTVRRVGTKKLWRKNKRLALGVSYDSKTR